ncbi:hypothetical protein EV06_0877 [Prochlorococcus sp. MIT 0602]|nr:hypothetical protein EV06_0877 [Prochlorococcus sp. MIT 0602]KGG17287.1 hypothetical protein EV07_0725 [Prochlorococcus sp. MIT 0603]
MGSIELPTRLIIRPAHQSSRESREEEIATISPGLAERKLKEQSSVEVVSPDNGGDIHTPG